jgi:hypothetical protein
MKAKHAFVPDPLATLEDRAVPAAIVLTSAAAQALYASVIRAIDTSFQLYGKDFNVNHLATHLVKSVSPVPYGTFAGLPGQMVTIALQTQANVINHVPLPLRTQEAAAIAAVNNVIAYTVATGAVVITGGPVVITAPGGPVVIV